MSANAKLYLDVTKKLHHQPDIDDSHITVTIRDPGIIILGGAVKSYAEKQLAQEAVERVKEVRGVANELTVNLAAAYKRSDADIVRAALNALKWIMFIPYESLKVAVEKGHLTLNGEVRSYYQKERAQKAVSDLYGVTHVTDNIKIRTDVRPSDVKEKIISEFERNARIDALNIKVEVEEHKVVLSGKVKNFDEVQEARKAAWSVPGITEVIDRLTFG